MRIEINYVIVLTGFLGEMISRNSQERNRYNIRKELPSKEPLTPLKGAPSPCGQGASTLLTAAPSGFIHMTKQKSLQDIVLKAFV
jgi:hypothetical protein